MTDDTNATEPSALRAKLEEANAKNKELSDQLNKLVEANRQNTVKTTLTALKLPEETLALVPDNILDADGVKSWVESHKSVLKFVDDSPVAPVDQAAPEPPVQAAPATTVSPEFVAAQQRSQQVATGASSTPPKDLADKMKALMNDESFLSDPTKSVDDIFKALIAESKKQ